MPLTKFPSFPPCCQKLLERLQLENRRGTRNCEKGHAISIEYAQQVEAQAARKAADAAAAEARAKAAPAEAPKPAEPAAPAQKPAA
jgi:hypothetical protein